MSEQIKVNFGAISGVAGQIDSKVKQIEGELEDLRSQISNLNAIWEGATSDGFQQVKNNWFQSADDLNGVLSRIAAVTHAAVDNYTRTESSNAQAWS